MPFIPYPVDMIRSSLSRLNGTAMYPNSTSVQSSPSRLNGTAVYPNNTSIQTHQQEFALDKRSVIFAVAILVVMALVFIGLIVAECTGKHISRPARRLSARARNTWFRIRNPAAAKALDAGSIAESGQSQPEKQPSQVQEGPEASGTANTFVEIPLGSQPGPSRSRQEILRETVKNNLKKGKGKESS